MAYQPLTDSDVDSWFLPSAKANIPFTDAQILEKGLNIIRQTQDFESGLEKWENKRTALQTWDNFKTHFQSAQALLKKTRDPTLQQAGFHHANMLVEKSLEKKVSICATFDWSEGNTPHLESIRNCTVYIYA